jgi:hypothetical protein
MATSGFYDRLKIARQNGGSPEGEELEACVRNTVEALLSSETDARRPGMLLGKIQSGKTRAFLGIIASAFDNGFDVAVVLTKGTKTLAQQTVNRISNEFRMFRDAEELAVYDIMNVPNLTDWEIDGHKLIFVAKKETNNMRRLVKLFAETHPRLRANLLAFFYGRSPKKMQQDTVLQHARMYGARPKPDLAVSRFYTTPSNYRALTRVHEFDSALRHAFVLGAHERGVAFVMKDQSNRIIPCAPSKILVSNIVSLRPNGALVPFGFQTKSKTDLTRIGGAVSKLIPAEVLESSKPIEISCELAVDLLSTIEHSFVFEDGYGFDWEAARAAIEYYSRVAAPAETRGRCWLFAGTGRTISRRRSNGRFSDAPLSYQERTAFRTLPGALPILALLHQEGRAEDGWRDASFWWPVIVAPARSVPSIFATSVHDSDDDDRD